MIGSINFNQTGVDIEWEVVGADRLQLLPVPVPQTASRVKLHQNVELLGLARPHHPALHLRLLLHNHEQRDEELPHSDRVAVSEVGVSWQRVDQLDPEGTQTSSSGCVVGGQQHLAVDGVGDDHQVIVSTDDQLGIVAASEVEQQLGVVDVCVVSVESEGFAWIDEGLIEEELSHVVEPSFLADHM